MERLGAVAVLALAFAGTGVGQARAQAPGYGGGSLPYTSPPRGFAPSVGITLQPRGERIGLRFDTTLRCGRTTHEAVGRKTVPLGLSSFAASGGSVVRSGRVRLEYARSLRGTVAGDTATGSLRITGRRRTRGRWVRCTRRPVRGFQARLATAPRGAAAAAARPGGAYLGLSDIELGDGLRAPVVLRATRDGAKVAARWNALARCGRGPRARLVNFTPATRIRQGGSFARNERFSVRYSDAVVRYRVRFAGRLLSDGATGDLCMRARVFDRAGRRLLTRCDTGTRAWRALAAASAPPAAGGPPPAAGVPGTPPPASTDSPARPVPGTWSLHMQSEPGDYIGQGRTYDFSSPDDQISAGGSPRHLDFSVMPPGGGGDYSAGFFAPEGQTLVAGATYTDNAIYTATPADAGIAMGAESRGCNDGVGSFTVDELTFDPNGVLRSTKVRWTFRCRPGDPAIHGDWRFRAA